MSSKHFGCAQDRQAELLRDELESVLALIPDAAGLYDLAKEPLTREGRGLAAKTEQDRPWPLLPLLVCEAVSGNYERALPAAAGLQFLMASADVYDDIEDADSCDSVAARYGFEVATNVATTLLILAERTLVRLKGRGVEDGILIRVMDTVNSFYTTACAGQHLDLTLTSKTAISEDEYLRAAYMKSASTVECTCHIGALLARADEELIDAFAQFGKNLGIAYQIANDIRGISKECDIAKHRMSLPVIYALIQIDGIAREQLELAFEKPSQYASASTEIKDLLFRTGAIHYSAVKLELYKQRALDILSEAERMGANVEQLRLFADRA